MPRLPRYPIYVPSKGRQERCLTANFFERDGVPFYIVVEPQEHDSYAALYGEHRVLVLPFRDLGSVVPARNWIKDHATEAGHERHWQFDDNIRKVVRWYRGKRIRCAAGVALAATEDFIDRYENVAVAGLNYTMFAVNDKQRAFTLNCHVYSASLILNSLPNRFRGQYNEDTDLCLQVLADGWCTILMNAFLVEKMQTLTQSGGNTAELYAGDGRLKMARSLERVWPGVVTTKRRFQRPQHVVHDGWKKFDTKLKRRPGLVLPDAPDEYGMKLKKAAPKIQSARLRKLVRQYQSDTRKHQG
jgi:hypothetical protein